MNNPHARFARCPPEGAQSAGTATGHHGGVGVDFTRAPEGTQCADHLILGSYHVGLLDSLLGQVLGGAQGAPGGGGDGNAALLRAVMGMLGNDAPGGGLGALIAGFQRGGLGDVMSSWISTGQNQPISAEQLGRVLGPDTLSALTRQTDGQSSDVLTQLAHLLPQVIDQLTPHGHVPASGIGNTSDLLGMLGPR
jgi:uncharacterized protein YidB (DUF937 family)